MNAILEYLQKWAKANPDKVFLTDENNQNWTFLDFYNSAAKFSTFLLSVGIQNGSFVVIHLDKKIEHLLAYVALLNIGAVSVHLYPERDDKYVEFAIKHTQAKAVISNKFKGDANSVLVLNFDLKEELEPTYNNTVNEIAYVMFTSGTTSSPKAVITTQKNIIFVTKTLVWLANMRERSEREIILLPLGSTGGLGHFHACLMLGNYARLYPVFYNVLKDDLIENFLRTIEKDASTGVLLTPRLIGEMLYNHRERLKQAGQTLRYALANVTPMRKEVIEQFLLLLPNLRFCTYYGSTEASRSIVNVCRESGEKMHLTGKPSHGVEIRIDKSNAEIWIKGDNVAQGYLHEKSPSFHENWFKSGDVGEIDNEGFIRVLGRVKEMINIDGIKILPSEIENIVLALKEVKDAAAFAQDVNNFEKQIFLAIVLENKNIDKKNYSTYLLNLLKDYFKTNETKLFLSVVPKKIYFVESIPRTELGKIKREELGNMFSERKTKGW